MKFTIETHLDREFKDPEITVIQTVDKPKETVFIPSVHIKDATGTYHHDLPPQNYVNGTWTDDDVRDAVERYFISLDTEKNSEESSFWDKLNPLKWFS